MPVASIATAVIGGIGANKAAKAYKSGADQANATQRYMFDTQRQDFAPWRQAGSEAIGQLRDIVMGKDGVDYSSYFKSPGYDFTLNEGMRGLENRASVGSLLSGRTLKDIIRFGQDHANKYAQNYINDLKSIAGAGQQAVTSSAALGQQNANAQAQAQLTGAQAQAAGYLGIGNSITGGISDIAKMYGYNRGVPSADIADQVRGYGTQGYPGIPGSTPGFISNYYGEKYA